MARILIVDDDPAVRDVLEHALWREGMETQSAPDGEKALQSLHDAKPFDLVGRQVFAEGGLVELTAKEFDVLWLLASHPAQDARGCAPGNGLPRAHPQGLRTKMPGNRGQPHHSFGWQAGQ